MLQNLKTQRGPIVLHVVTKKGKGYELAEADPTTYHGVSHFDPEAGVQAKKSSAPTFSNVFGRWICDTAEKDPRTYAITPAMTEGSDLDEFAKRFPKRFRDVAIAEQHSVTYAAGLACGGMKPVVAIYSTFAQRAYDQIEHDVALQHLPVVFAVDRGGIVGHAAHGGGDYAPAVRGNGPADTDGTGIRQSAPRRCHDEQILRHDRDTHRQRRREGLQSDRGGSHCRTEKSLGRI